MKKGRQTYNALLAGGPNSRYALKDAKPAGFLVGIWHGIIAPVTFIIGLFNPNVRMYEVHNNGGWYDFGFLLGVGAFSGSTKRATTG